MANKKISDLTAAVTLALTDLVAIAQGSTTLKATLQQLHDIIVAPAYGSIRISASAPTVLTDDTPAKVAGTTAFKTGIASPDFDDDGGVSNRLRHTGTVARDFQVKICLSVTSAGSNQDMTLYLAKNGAIDSETQIFRKIGAGSDQGAVGVCPPVNLAENDFVELWIENTTSSTNITVTAMNMTITRLR